MSVTLLSVVDMREVTGSVPATAPDTILSKRAYNNQQRPMRPQRIYAMWGRDDDEPWTLRDLTVSGGLIKKDGTVGMSYQESQFYRYGRQIQDIPAWLSSAINSVQPEGRW